MLLDRRAETIPGDPLAEALRLIRSGSIVGVKGLGGFHVACDASDEGTVALLRQRKGREEKPLALMVPDLEGARRLAEIGDAEADLLRSPQRPIVLVARRADAPIAPSVAPDNPYLGLMMPYTPLHHLLLDDLGSPLVVTSGNRSGEPISYTDNEAFRRLSPLVDAFLTHDRDIAMRCDDSVAMIIGGAHYPIRRARGYAPRPINTSHRFSRPTLAVGAELKNTFCVGLEDRAILSHHIGDLEDFETMASFRGAIEHICRLYHTTPEVVAHDLHPEYLSTKWALELEAVKKVAVQHHHAHVASCLADNGRADAVIGLALDGTGYGTDGALWGCEVLVCDLRSFRRAGHLSYMPMPGGEAAIKEPWRMAVVYLEAAFGTQWTDLRLPLVAAVAEHAPHILQMTSKGINSPRASSAGRLFDAASAICGIRTEVSYEGQAAAELEWAADPAVTLAYPCAVVQGQIDGIGLIAHLAEDVGSGRPVPEAAAAFHNGLAEALVEISLSVEGEEGIGTVALSGGTWQNRLLCQRTTERLEKEGFEVLRHHRVPTNDGGIALGQAIVAENTAALED